MDLGSPDPASRERFLWVPVSLLMVRKIGAPPIGSEVPRDLLDALSHPVILLGLVFREGNPEICGEGEDLPVALFKTAPKRSEQICRTRPRADRKDKRLWPDGIR